MAKIIYLNLLFLIIGSCLAIFQEKDVFREVRAQHTVAEQTVGQPWPQPKKIESSSTFFTIDPHNFEFKISTPSKECDILTKAIDRYKSLTFINSCPQGTKKPRQKQFSEPQYASGEIPELTIIVYGDCEDKPYLYMEESYSLIVNSPNTPGEAYLSTSTVWGALRGLETFSQIVYQVSDSKFAVNTTLILDEPRFPHRGLLIDSARHFLSVNKIIQTLDALVYNKMNVLHWHITDDQSFPYQSKKFPYLSEKGAYDPVTHVYSAKDVATVIEEARIRGIRVVVEFDSPGHTLSWYAQNGLLTPCYNGNKPDGTFGPINPILNSTYTFLNEFFAEVAATFPDQYIHLGGDEVSFNCWQSNPDISDFMKKNNIDGDYSKLEQYYVQKLLDIVASLKKSYVVWQEVFDNGVKIRPETVVHVWKGPQDVELQKVTAAGYNALLSACWYLDIISYGADWVNYYKCEPLAFNGTAQQKSLVLGGEACIWAEYVDGTNLISRTWPRASAAAEKLWSPESVNNVNAASPRFEEHRCRMIKRGLTPEPQIGPGHCECDYAL